MMRDHLNRVRPTGFKPFDGVLTMPKQLEIHLPNASGISCNLKCNHCEGQLLPKEMSDDYLEKAISLIDQLGGSIPRVVVSGSYSEPTLNPRLISLLEAVKASGSDFGLHTNGTLLSALERKNGFLTRLAAISEEDKDYLAVSIDACDSESFTKTKNAGGRLFEQIINGLFMFDRIKQDTGKTAPKAGVSYLLNEHNCDPERLRSFTQTMRDAGVSTLRFSVPYAPYGTSQEERSEYEETTGLVYYEKYAAAVASLLSQDPSEKPFVFLLDPEKQSIGQLTFTHCFYGYYMLTLGADGFFYRCCAVANPRFKSLRLGPLTDNLEEFYAMILKNQNKDFDPNKRCFNFGTMCTRAALEINAEFENQYFGDDHQEGQ